MPLALELTGVDFAYGQGPPVLTARRPARRARRVRRDRRPERRRQDDAASARARSRAADARRGAALRRAGAELPRPHEHRLPRAAHEDRAARAGDGARRRRGRARAAAPVRPAAAKTITTRSTRRSSASGCARLRGDGCGLCPAGSNSVRSSRRRSRRIPSCSCSTSPRRASTSRRRTRWARCSTGCTTSSA